MQYEARWAYDFTLAVQYFDPLWYALIGQPMNVDYSCKIKDGM